MRNSIIFAAVLIPIAAHADTRAKKAMDAYTGCWSNVVSTLSIDKPGKAKEREAHRLTKMADRVCGPQSDVAAAQNGLAAAKDTRHYMEVQFYNANFQMDAK